MNLSKSRGSSSIDQLNHTNLERFPDVQRFQVEEVSNIDTTTLDKLYEKSKLNNIDFIKPDTQAAELNIF